MFCANCGRSVLEGARFCPNCGAAMPMASADPAFVAAPMPAAPTAMPGPPAAVASSGAGEAPATGAPRVLAGFWRRLWALFLDGFVLGAVFAPFFFLLVFPMLAERANQLSDAESAAGAMVEIWAAMLPIAVLGGLGRWLYAALFQSSKKQATLGQMALGIRVTDVEGRRISFARATGRHFAHIVTGLTFGIGYLTMLWTQRKQCLHDMIAGTMVERVP
jgi:uncharacterized RDD family membrane protein YckC